jgi:putative hydrolase of the HAD superfamily
MQYQHLFFDLDHTLWDFETNSKQAMHEIYIEKNLSQKGITDFDVFFEKYNDHNHRLWDKYSKGQIKQDELRWKRMWLTLVDFKIADEPLARAMGVDFIEILPNKNNLFPYTREILTYLQSKQYSMHLITNGFEKVQFNKLEKSDIQHFFKQVITSEGCNSLKPNKEIFDYALVKAGANTQQSIMIGDNIEADILGGMNAGLDTIFVNHINATTDVNPTYTIRKLKELEDIL